MRKFTYIICLFLIIMVASGCGTISSDNQNVQVETMELNGVKLEGSQYKNVFIAADPDAQLGIGRSDGSTTLATGDFFVLHTTIVNNSDKPINLDLTNFELTDKDKKSYSTITDPVLYNDYFLEDHFNREEKPLNHVTLNPGLTYNTALVFDIPTSMTTPSLETNISGSWVIMPEPKIGSMFHN